jgi:hypothetical protein
VEYFLFPVYGVVMVTNLGFFAIVEIIVFNLVFIFIYQPAFIFDILKPSPEWRSRLSRAMTALGLLMMCFLFCWSFYFGAFIVLQKNELMKSY